MLGERRLVAIFFLGIISTECNDIIIGNNILLLNHEFKELVHEHLALFIYLLIYV